MAVYLVVTLVVSDKMAASARCGGVVISIKGDTPTPFVTADDIDHELGGFTAKADTMPLSAIDMSMVEKQLSALSTIESARCYRSANDRLHIDVTPMVPVARVFDGRRSYYINRDGKRLTANARYQVDAPVIIGRFDSIRSPRAVLPLLERIAGNESWNSLVSAIEVARNGDIILIPSISGHVVNFGDTNAIDDKFKRLTAFYRQVMPVKGWNHYDTVSVKFSGQIVANVAPGRRNTPVNQYSDEDFVEEPDDASMTTDGIDVNLQKPKL